MKKNIISQFEKVIVKSIQQQKNTYLEEVNKSVQFESTFLQVLKSPKTINLRAFIRNHLNPSVCLYGVPVLELLSPDFTFARDAISAIATCLTFDKGTNYKLVFANLSNLAAYNRVQAYEFYNSKKYEKYKLHNSCFIETGNHVIFPAFNFVIEKDTFYKMTDPIIFNQIDSSDLEQTVIFKRIKKASKKQNPTSPRYDYTFMSLQIDELLLGASEKSEGIEIFPKTHTDKLKQIDSELYYMLIADRKVLAKAVYNIENNMGLAPYPPSEDPDNDDDFKSIYSLILDISKIGKN